MIVDTHLEDYIEAHGDVEVDYLAKIDRNTHLFTFNPRMLSGHQQGRLLSMFSKMISPNRILELGTFTGYSALCLAEGLSANGQLHTVESNDELEALIRSNFALSPYNHQIELHICGALDFCRQTDEMFDLVFMDADKREYSDYYDALFDKIRPGGYIIADNTLWDGKVLETPHPSDKQTIAIKKFNNMIAQDQRIEKIILPLRDGMTIIRKKDRL